jgi:hypothetical protein
MKWILLVASLAICALLVPAISSAQDSDGDGIGDHLDNCLDVVNPAQDDSDLDDCGNLCDADYDNNGIVGFSDFGILLEYCFRPDPPEVVCHLEPIPDCTCGFADFGFFVGDFGTVPGPSGSTAGTTACP